MTIPTPTAVQGESATAEIERRVFETAAMLGRMLRERGWTIACAESCTGGLVCRALTEVAGSSEWFERGFISYSNAAKADMLGVSADTLKLRGAVSEETAREMAEGALARSRAQLSLAITGIAGPGGAAPGKPVGTVCFGWTALDCEARTETRQFAGDRASVRAQAALHALLVACEQLRSLAADATESPSVS